MEDKSTGVFLLVFFGLVNIAVLLLVWVQPMPESERILATFVGSGGLLIVLIKALMLGFLKVGIKAEKVAVAVNIEDKL